MNLCLRRGIEVGSDGSQLVDPILARTVTLGEVSRAIVPFLDGGRDAEAVIQSLPQHPREEVERGLRTLLWLNLLESVDAETLEKVRVLRSGERTVGRVILPNTRFGCVGSGDCCQSYHFGPLTDEDIALLESLPIREHFPHLGEGPYWYWRDMPTGNVQGRFLNAVDNRCVFLRDDCRCGLHAEFGYDKKPGLCRYYPFEQRTTIDGVQMYDKGGCSEYAKTARSGAPLKEQLLTLGPLFPPTVLDHPVALLDETTAIDYGFLHPLLSASVDEVGRGEQPAPMLLRAHSRRMVELLRGVLGARLAPDAPRLAVEETLATPFHYNEPDEETLREGAAAVAGLAAAMADRVTEIIAREHQASAEFYSGRQSKELIPALLLVAEAASHRSQPSSPLSSYAAELGAVPIDDPGVDEVLRLSLQNQLFGHGALLEDRVAPALLRLALWQLVTLWGGRRTARIEGRPRVAPDDLSRTHALAQRVFNFKHTSAVFREEAPHAFVALEALPAIARWA